MVKLRISHVIVQPVLVWDDGEELSPGPDINPIQVSVSQLGGLSETLPAQVEAIKSELDAELDTNKPHQQ